ncbi:MAG TPA: PQQ-binding-like beta-propeller repeat protein [Planctomycetota bacterium]|nr:PQQ-binding-like beta-propeller repeat protein [Planctomycetota bacterium]
MTTRRVVLAAWCGLLLLVSYSSWAQDWPALSGPDHNRVVDATGLRETWTDAPPIRWQIAVGFGQAPAVVRQGRVFTIGLVQAGQDPFLASSAPSLAEVAAGTFRSGDVPGMPTGLKTDDYPLALRGDLYALCVQAEDGAPCWKTRLTDAGIAFKTVKHSSTAWDLASPAVTAERLFIHTHTGDVYALDVTDGRVLWHTSLFEHHMGTWYGGQQGNSSAPLVIGDVVVVSCENATGHLTVVALDQRTGAERWMHESTLVGMNVRASRLGYGTPGGVPTLLGSCGSGTIGLAPDTGVLRWSFDVIAETPQTRQQVPPAYQQDPKAAKDYRIDALRTPFSGFAPVTWGDYVVDAACVGHNAVTSSTWCLKISGGHAALVWQTTAFVPLSASLKSPMIAYDGKLYGCDSYFPLFAKHYLTTRPYRGAGTGEFQCRSLADGALCWSSDAFNPLPADVARADSQGTTFLIAGDRLILSNSSGGWIARLHSEGPATPTRLPVSGVPVLADGRLYVRGLTPRGDAQGTPGAGNLVCLDLRTAP